MKPPTAFPIAFNSTSCSFIIRVYGATANSSSYIACCYIACCFVLAQFREAGNRVDPVVSLGFAKPQVVFESSFGPDRALAVIVVPAEAICSCRPPGIAEHEKRSAIRKLQRVVVRSR